MRKTLTVMAMVIALAMSTMAGAVASGQSITSPEDGDIIISDTLKVRATGVGDSVTWGFRYAVIDEEPIPSSGGNECWGTGDGTWDIDGNVGRPGADSTFYDLIDGNFSVDIDVADLDDGSYCLVVGGNERQVVFFELGTADSKDACKDGGWETFGEYRNQGQCVSEFARKQRDSE